MRKLLQPKWCCPEGKRADGSEIVFYMQIPDDPNITPVRADAKFYMLCRGDKVKEIQYCPWCGKRFEVEVFTPH